MLRKQTGDVALGRRIRAKREWLGLTQFELARKVGISQPSISAFESGAANPELKTLRIIARTLQESADYLLLGTGGTRRIVANELKDFSEYLFDALPASAWRALAGLSESRRQQAVDDFAALLAALARDVETSRPVRKRRARR